MLSEDSHTTRSRYQTPLIDTTRQIVRTAKQVFLRRLSTLPFRIGEYELHEVTGALQKQPRISVCGVFPTFSSWDLLLSSDTRFTLFFFYTLLCQSLPVRDSGYHLGMNGLLRYLVYHKKDFKPVHFSRGNISSLSMPRALNVVNRHKHAHRSTSMFIRLTISFGNT